MQAFITHSMLPKLVSKYPWMCGMAMFTIVPSSRIMKRPRQSTASTAHGFRAGLAGGASAVFEFTSGGGGGAHASVRPFSWSMIAFLQALIDQLASGGARD